MRQILSFISSRFIFEIYLFLLLTFKCYMTIIKNFSIYQKNEKEDKTKK